ncbi:DUF5689 domain-containing protein [uncultured Croceitalea sp.]|uniref:DUF5689 domain-containing protein n=1 Tax=uncultured Croceitalea sp. TaxID=1798908 RepID=UPI003305BF90
MSKNYFLAFILGAINYACAPNSDFDAPSSNCTDILVANTTFAEVKALYQGELLEIQEDNVLEGYVGSSDRKGNFFSVLYFQDSPVNPTEGFQVQIDVRDSYLQYPVGSKVFIKLKGLYLGESGGGLKLGGTFAGFGTTAVGRLPALKVPEHLFVSCNDLVEIEPTAVSIVALDEAMANTLVRLEDVEFSENEVGLTFSEKGEETERQLVDCFDDGLPLINSGFSDFQSEILPDGRGSITGILLQERDGFKLVIRDVTDIDFSEERCEALVTEFTSQQLMITELADPNNNSGARFVELYNAAAEDLNTNGWTLRRYTNANTEVSSIVDLTDQTIKANTAFVISPNAQVFESVYGFAPDLEVGTNSPADSNGDDTLVLVDPFGTIVDIFGVIGEDGTGTNHEFEDGRAVRNSDITKTNATYTFSEWQVFNDSGNAGTFNRPQMAPDDFTPGLRD